MAGFDLLDGYSVSFAPPTARLVLRTLGSLERLEELLSLHGVVVYFLLGLQWESSCILHWMLLSICSWRP